MSSLVLNFRIKIFLLRDLFAFWLSLTGSQIEFRCPFKPFCLLQFFAKVPGCEGKQEKQRGVTAVPAAK